MLVLRRQKKIYRQETKKNTLAKNINNLENDLILWVFFCTFNVVESFFKTRYLAN